MTVEHKRQGTSRKRFLQAVGGAPLALGGLGALVSRAEPVDAAGGAARYLVVLTLDACRYDYLTLAPMRHLQSLIKGGTSYDRAWVGQLASETPTGHATLGTGAFPCRHGILGFDWRDGKTHKRVEDGWPAYVKQGLLDHDLSQAKTNSVTQTVKKAGKHSTVVAVSSEKVYAADAMGGWAADHVLFNARSTHSPTLVPQNLKGHRALPPGFFNDPALAPPFPVKSFTEWDETSALMAVRAVEELRPTVLMVNFPGLDVYGHPYGGPASPDIMGRLMRGIDRGIGQIMGAYRKAGILDQTLFLIVGDHGMVPNTHAISTQDVTGAVARAGAELLFQTGGTAKYIYLQDPATAGAVAAQISTVDVVAAAYYLTSSGGTYTYVQGGQNRLDPAVQAAHAYLLETFAGDRAPDVVAALRENTIGRAIPTLYGYHGGLNWGSHHIPFVLSGPGVRGGQTSHFPARLVDVAPTVLSLMGLRGTDMDGVVLADAMMAPEDAMVQAQGALAPVLAGYQDALMAQSAADIAEDQRNGPAAPPRAPVHPYWAGTCCGHAEGA